MMKFSSRGVRSWTGLCCSIWGIVGTVHGQGVTPVHDPAAPWLRYNVGKVVVLPRLDMATMYTDNLFSMKGVDKLSDMVTMVTPGLRLKWDENAQVKASAGYVHGETLILENSGYNSSSDTADAAVSYSGSKLRVRGKGSYSDSVRLQGGNMNLGRQLLGSVTASGDVQATYDWTAKTDINGGIHYLSNDYDSRYLVDSRQIDGHLGSSYEMTTKLRFTADAKLGSTEATGKYAGSKTVGSLFYGALVGAKGSFSPKITGSARIGYELRNIDGGAAISASTPALALDVTYAPSMKTQLVLGYDRTTFISQWANAQVTIRDTVRLQALQVIGSTGRWLASATARLAMGDYTAGNAINFPGSISLARSDQMYGLDLGMQYRPQPWLTCVAGYTFEKFDVHFEDRLASFFILARNYSAHRVTASVSVGF